MISKNKTKSSKSEILYGSENAIDRGIRFMQNTKIKMDITFDHKAPSIVVKLPAYCNGYKDILARGGKIRCITEVTPENIPYCKELLNLVSGLRHLDGLKGGIAINESEYMATTVLQEAQPLTEVIYSNVGEVVAQGQYIFDTLWRHSTPAFKRIREIEYGIEPIKTEVLESAEEIADKIYKIIKESNYLRTCSTIGGMQLSRRYYLDINRKILRDHQQGKHSGIKWITSINDKNDINIVKLFTKDGIKIKHTSDRPSINFVISDKCFASTTEKMIGGEMFSNLIISNDPLYLEHFSTIFDNIWEQSVEAKDRIKELMDTDLFKAKIISNPDDSIRLINKLYSSAQKEILIILPSVNGLLRIINSGGLEKLNELASRGVTVKILIIHSHKVDHLKQIITKYSEIKFRTSQFNFPILNRITIIDRTKTIILKIKDDTKTNVPDASGVATFIDGESTALSYTGIFETLWNQTEMFESLKKINEQLQSNERVQKEFLDIIAHELRSPIQPIIGLTEYVKGKLKDKKQIELLDSVITSGQKLNTLTENILDVSRIEDHLFRLKKEKFNLSVSISNTIKNFEDLLRKSKTNIKFEFNNSGEKYFVIGDRTRIEQVVSNLVYNSIKSISRKNYKKRRSNFNKD
ncbi:sensor histidine kinase [Candidatus Nitrosocosmicus arcticus]|uniref:histidine kinase n=1 Tax=Candidatus Nitrosocosmicus arcticus TaxID=2035267 RepID=A0A557STT0_9ARCH|nr:HAMP domain-containing sensor histidine kinase [Candidatus Nitrosocosmicus arcticus]TVP39998.1 putative signal transduction histidine kinase with phosphoacceptor and ATP binding domain [Candidatus Nitrosocosmicus arcticus]